MNELTKRIIVAVIGIPIAFVAIYFGEIIFTVLIAIISSLALKEFYALAEKKGYPTFKIWGIFIGLIPFAAYIISSIDDNHKEVLPAYGFILVSLLFITVIAIGTLLLVLFSKRQNAIASIGTVFTGFFYISFSFFTLILLRDFDLDFRFVEIENFGLFIVIIMFCSIWVCDSAAYFIGRKFGKHKLLERVSPKKSIEGAVAGLIASTVFFPLATYLLMPEFNIIFSFMLGIIVGFFGQIGDLVESKLKRDADVKDSSNLIPGHGGVLDRFDSIIFVSPIVFIFLVILDFVL